MDTAQEAMMLQFIFVDHNFRLRGQPRWLVFGLISLLLGSFPGMLWAQSGIAGDPGSSSDVTNDENVERNLEAQSEEHFNAIMQRQDVVPKSSISDIVQPDIPQPAGNGEVVMPLANYQALRQEQRKIQQASARLQGPAVILGASEYHGVDRGGVLALAMKLQVSLGQPGQWKTVPLIGDSVVLKNARINDEPIAVTRQNSYHVWLTQRSGEIVIDLKILVPSQGPRGSIEYSFHVPKTSVTKFQCEFAVADVEPKLSAAVEAESVHSATATIFRASLRPTTRIHFVGFKDLGEQAGQSAKVYAESLNLLSIDEETLELFAVFRYTILYAGTKQFTILIPPDMQVLQADGKGAFRYQLEQTPKGLILAGETAFPIRNGYEISLRLKREIKKGEESLQVPLPTCLNVERESGWLGIEVPGQRHMAEKASANIQEVDIRQLPADMIHSAITPILKAYRYHAAEPRLQLLSAKLPTTEPASASIDRLRAFTRVTPQGNVVSDVRITLRNRLKHRLALTLPGGSRVISALLDGEPLSLSQDEDGKILLPLKRSVGEENLQPFTLAVVLEHGIERFRFCGRPSLALPSLDMPISSLLWSVYLPAEYRYSALHSDIAAQQYVSQASWYQPPPFDLLDPNQAASSAAEPNLAVFSSNSGIMPVRFEIPKNGIELEYARYWIEPEKAVRVSFYYLLDWLRRPLALLALLGLALSALGASRTVLAGPFYRWRLLGLGALFLAAGVATSWLSGSLTVTFGILLALTFIAVQRHWPAAILTWATALPTAFAAREILPRPWTLKRLGRSALLGGAFGLLALLGAVGFIRLLFLLLNRPLGG
jgi:hypothetical protein